MSDLRTAAQQALEAWDGGDIEWFKRAYTVMENLRAALAQEPTKGAWHDGVLEGQLRERERWLAQQDEPVAADALTEPKSGDKWRVEWWNESCRMMLPAHAKLDSFVAYKNGTIQFTIKRTAA